MSTTTESYQTACILHQSAKKILPNNRVALRTPSDNHSLRYHIISSNNHDTTKHVILLKMHNIHNSSNSSRTKALTSMVTLPFPTILVPISSLFLVPTRTPFPAYPSREVATSIFRTLHVQTRLSSLCFATNPKHTNTSYHNPSKTN